MSRAAALGIAVLAAAPDAAAQGWDLQGTNTVRVEDYEVRGARAASPYPSTGAQRYDELELQFRRRLSPYESQRGYVGGVVNDSAYRSGERGAVLERASLFWEKGDGPVPFRLEAGDFFAYQSLRTVQRSLKGVQVELQPPPASPGTRHSLQLFTGLAAPVYRDLDENQDLYTGLSWVAEGEGFGSLMLGGVHNVRESRAGGPDGGGQWVGSLAWHRNARVGDQELALEAELARLHGDVSGTRDADGGGVFLEMAGRSAGEPLSYRAVYARYGADFRPNGAAVSPDQRRLELHAGWRFGTGLSVRGRAQSFRDGLEGGNPLETRVLGFAAAGPVAAWGGRTITINADAYVRERGDRYDTVDGLTRSLNAAASLPLRTDLSVRAGLRLAASDDRNADLTTVSRQASAALDWSFDAGRFRGTLSPGLLLRRNTGRGAGTDSVSPNLALLLAGGPHRLSFSHNALLQDARFAGGADLLTLRTALSYSYTRGAHTFGLDLEHSDRDPAPGDDTRAWRIGAFWMLSFERSAAVPAPAPAAVAPAAAGHRIPDLYELAPGMALDEARRRLAQAGISGAARQPGLLVYETRLLPQIDRRQRLALVHDGGRLQASVLVIDFDEVGDEYTASQIFERVRESLLRRYGPPALRIEEGAFGPDLAQALNTGRFTRLMQWETPWGRLRFGIPRRTDGQVRMEARHAAAFPPGQRSDWSLERLR